MLPALALALVASASSAAAQPAGPALAPVAQPPTTTKPEPSPPVTALPLAAPRTAKAHVLGSVEDAAPRSPYVALTLSALGTAVPAAMMYSDSSDMAFVGWMALLLAPSMGHWYAGKRFTLGMGVRLTSVGLIAMAVNNGSSDIVYTAIAALAMGSALDLATAPDAARRHNARLKLTPTVLRSHSGGAPGLAAVGAF